MNVLGKNFLSVSKGFVGLGFVLSSLVGMSFAQANATTSDCFGQQASTEKSLEKMQMRMSEKRSVMALAAAPQPFQEIFDILGPFVPEKVSMEYDETNEFNAYATNSFGGRVIVLFAGLMTHPTSNKDMVALVACHELGHHFAGAPQFGWKVMSYEGQSDFYASQSCFNTWLERSTPIDPQDPEAKAYCEDVVKRPDAKCVRSMSASLRLGKVMAEFKKLPVPSLSATDPAVVSRTQSAHPQAQCRVDTYRAGYNVFSFGAPAEDPRPRCWFKPGR